MRCFYIIKQNRTHSTARTRKLIWPEPEQPKSYASDQNANERIHLFLNTPEGRKKQRFTQLLQFDCDFAFLMLANLADYKWLQILTVELMNGLRTIPFITR